MDLGCGTGHLTHEIAQAGAVLLGIDKSAEMIEQASRNYPGLEFAVADATEYVAAQPFDAVFSNAVLHWIRPPEAVARTVQLALKSGGRFVAELGGKGNTQSILDVVGRNDWYFPSIGEYASLLEQHRLEVVQAVLFDRPTPLEGEHGLRDWLNMFFKPPLSEFEVERAERCLRPKLFRDGTWYLDYRRLRIVAKLR